MADRVQDALDCAARRREREAHPVPAERYACRCDHDHPPGVSWCDLCENPVFTDGELSPVFLTIDEMFADLDHG